MSIKTNYFDGNSVGAADLIAPWAALLSDGVCSAAGFAVSADSPADLSVSVAPGVAVKSGHVVRSDAVESVAETANTSGYNRVDIVALRVDDVNKATALVIVQGTPSSSPTPPVLLSTDLPLAQITVGNNVSVINSGAIIDMRQPVLGPSDYPGKYEASAGAEVPWNRLKPDGRAVSRVQFWRIFGKVGTTYGAGDGSTTFNLPDARGKTIVGQAPGDSDFGTLGAAAGAKTNVAKFVSPVVYIGDVPYLLSKSHWQLYDNAIGAIDIASINTVNTYAVGAKSASSAEVHTINASPVSTLQPSIVGTPLLVW